MANSFCTSDSLVLAGSGRCLLLMLSSVHSGRHVPARPPALLTNFTVSETRVRVSLLWWKASKKHWESGLRAGAHLSSAQFIATATVSTMPGDFASEIGRISQSLSFVLRRFPLTPIWLHWHWWCYRIVVFGRYILMTAVIYLFTPWVTTTTTQLRASASPKLPSKTVKLYSPSVDALSLTQFFSVVVATLVFQFNEK